VRGAEFFFHLGVGLGPGVFVFYPETNRRAERHAFESAGKDLDGVRLFARGNDTRLARPAAVKVRLDVCFGQREARWTAVHNHSHAAAVGFAPGGDAEQVTEGVRHAGIVRQRQDRVKRGLNRFISPKVSTMLVGGPFGMAPSGIVNRAAP
jgi:hypothetical protein